MLHIICRLLCWSGLPWFIREVYARRKVTIVNYHNPKPDLFEKHLQYYRGHYTFVNIDQVIGAIKNRTFSQLPIKSLLLVFDDGYIENVDLFPILQRYRVPAVIYVVAGVVNTMRDFWFDRLPHHSEAMRNLKDLPDDERRMKLKNDYNHWDEKEYGRQSALSSDQLKSFVDIGGTVGSHTLFHPLLDHCKPDVGFWECSESRDRLENLVGKPVVHFALPNGNGNEEVLDWVRRSGYHSCRANYPGWVTSKTSPFFLPNFNISDSADIYKAEIQACGLWYIFKRLLKKEKY